VGAAAPAERDLFESTMHSAGLDPEGSGAAAERLEALVGVGSGNAKDAPLEQYLPATAGEPQGATLATVALAEAASRSGGAPFATRWRTSSGRTVERSLVPIPDLQTLAVPPAGGEPGEIAAILDSSEVLFNAAKAGVRLIDQTMLAGAQRLLVAADANAVPPSGIEGIGAKDLGLPIETAGGVVRGLGALAIGDVKYKVHTGLLAAMHEASEPLFLAHEEAFALARRLVG
jgi:hypothetical protein